MPNQSDAIKNKLLDLIKDLNQEAVRDLLMEMAEAKNIVVIATMTEDDLGLPKDSYLAERIHYAMNAGEYYDWDAMADGVKKAIADEDAGNIELKCCNNASGCSECVSDDE